jgi:hypothetical protein
MRPACDARQPGLFSWTEPYSVARVWTNQLNSSHPLPFSDLKKPPAVGLDCHPAQHLLHCAGGQLCIDVAGSTGKLSIPEEPKVSTSAAWRRPSGGPGGYSFFRGC